MAESEFGEFLQAVAGAPTGTWMDRQLIHTAGAHPPDVLFRHQKSLLQADFNRMVVSWFLESICDPRGLETNYPGHGIVLGRLRDGLFPLLPQNIGIPERADILTVIFDLLKTRLDAVAEKRRAAKDTATKMFLLERAGNPPRCYVCGFAFAPEVIEGFISGNGAQRAKSPAFVDYLQPTGLKARDRSPEIDHVEPFSRGGQEGENLRLACGWCNSHKSWKTNIFDCSSEPIPFEHPKHGLVRVPQPFWVVRILAARGSCEHAEGCQNNVKNSKLLIQPETVHGAPNPLNLRVVCAKHDGLGSARLVHISCFR